MNPGKTRIETVGTAPAFVTLRLKANHEYFIRQAWHMRGAGVQPALDHLPKVKAEEGIMWCSYVESPSLVEETAEGTEEDKGHNLLK